MIIQLVLFYYYYNTIYLYKCCIHNVLSYGHLYYHFGCNLHESEGLIKNSASFKSPHITHTSLAHLANDHEGLQIARTLYYLFNYLIIYFRLVVYIVTCTVYIYMYKLYHGAEVYMDYIRPRASAYIIHIHRSISDIYAD